MKLFKYDPLGQIILSVVILVMVFTLSVVCLISATMGLRGKTIEELDAKIESLEEEASLLEEYVFGLTNTKEMLEAEKGLCDYYLEFEIKYRGNTLYRGESMNKIIVQVSQDTYENISYSTDLSDNKYFTFQEEISGWEITLVNKYTR